jgi:hypothetical protein
MHKSAQFRQMIDGTREEYALIAHYEDEYAKQLPDRVLEALAKLGDDRSLTWANQQYRDEDPLVRDAVLKSLADTLKQAQQPLPVPAAAAK